MNSKKFGVLSPFIVAVLILFPAVSNGKVSNGQTGTASTTTRTEKNVPPVAPSVIPEGAFALDLANRLGIGEAEDEAQAEEILSSEGIEPDNGWISEYPVTPDVLREIRDGVVTAAAAGRLDMDEKGALEALSSVNSGFDMNVTTTPPEDLNGGYSTANAPANIDDYYSTYGPPVVTYYAPPPSYSGLYAWVPSPFWWGGGFFFSGFFILNDFHRNIFFHRHAFFVSNRFFNPFFHRTVIIDPINRPFDRRFFAANRFRFASPRLFASRRFSSFGVGRHGGSFAVVPGGRSLSPAQRAFIHGGASQRAFSHGSGFGGRGFGGRGFAGGGMHGGFGGGFHGGGGHGGGGHGGR